MLVRGGKTKSGAKQKPAEKKQWWFRFNRYCCSDYQKEQNNNNHTEWHIQKLIEQRMRTPTPIDDEEDLDDTEKEKTNWKIKNQRQHQKSMIWMIKKIAWPSQTNRNNCCSHSSKRTQMFLNCVPITKNELGQDVLAKIWSVIRNTLFKSAKFYPQPSHANSVVGLCLYDCDFVCQKFRATL